MLRFLCCLRRRLDRKNGCGDGALSADSTSLFLVLRVVAVEAVVVPPPSPPPPPRAELRLFTPREAAPLVSFVVTSSSSSSSLPDSPSDCFLSLTLLRCGFVCFSGGGGSLRKPGSFG